MIAVDTMARAGRKGTTAVAMPLRVDFVADLTCPWCAIGLHTLELAIARLGDAMPVELHLQSFELNPDIAPDGEAIGNYAARKYGASADELAQRQALIRRRGAEVGLELATRTHVYNTFDAHRLLHWAALEGRQRELGHALLAAYHGRGENPARHDVLLRAAAEVGLAPEQACAVLDSGAYAGEVRASVRHWQQAGITSVPSTIVDRRHLIQGGQSADAFEHALREIAARRAGMEMERP